METESSTQNYDKYEAYVKIQQNFKRKIVIVYLPINFN